MPAGDFPEGKMYDVFGIFVNTVDPWSGLFDSDVEFFFQFAAPGLVYGFTGFYFATGKFP